MEPTQSSKALVTYKKYFRIIPVLSFFLFGLHGQEKITYSFEKTEVSSVINYLIAQHDLIIVYPDDIDDHKISSTCENCNGEEALSSILKGTTLSFEKFGDQFVVYFEKRETIFSLYGQSIDGESGEPISYANIHIPHLNVGDISNQNGIFSIPRVSSDLCTLVVSYIGYETVVKELKFPKDENIFHKIKLNPKIINSDEISILGANREFMGDSDIPGQISFSPKHVATLPNLGEVDIFRSIQHLPGVQFSLGSTSDLYIRGGSPDQNLITLDGMTLYQTSHMFGFLSSVSTETIKDVQIFKGHIPANFGGRTSSVIELMGRSGNNSNYRGSLYGNLMSSGISAEIPIFKKGSAIVNFRKSRPSNQFSKVYESIEKYMTVDNKFNLITETGEQNINQSTEYDLFSSYEDFFNRFSYLIDSKHRFTFTLISSKDSIFEDRSYYGFSNILESDTAYIEEKNSFKNLGQSINLYSQWNNKYSTHLSISSYSYENNYFSIQSSPRSNNISIIGTANKFHSLSDHSFRFIQQYRNMKNHNLSIGFEETYFSTHFKNKNTENSSLNTSFMIQDGYLYSFFVKNSWSVKNNWNFDTGIRYSYFDNLDKHYFEPRIAIICKVRQNLSLELSYGEHNQFIHKLGKENNSNFNINSRFLSSLKIPSILSKNFQSGISWNKNDYSFSTTFYVKNLNRFFQSKWSFSFEDYLSFNNEIINPGYGKIRGLEIQFRKKSGMITGWISYHNSNAKYQILNFNEGNLFFADHNKNHEIKTVVLGKIFNANLSASWVFSSGRPFTSLENLYVESGSGYEIFSRGNYNNKRVKSSHHLDISVVKSLEISKVGIEIGFSIYNLYNRKNIAHKRYNPFSRGLSIKDISMFGITPSVFTKIHF
ncbi:MAG: TonB-dependent receptor [Candidatus Neomarinimicrobiota bacterium]